MHRTLFTFCFLALSFFGFSQGSLNVTKLDLWDDTTVFANNGGARYNDVWGFIQGGREYAVIGSTKGTHIVEVLDDDQLEFRDFVEGQVVSASVVHRDFHDYNGYLYAIGQQGAGTLQIMDLSYLPDSVHVVYDDDQLFVVAHNIFIDTATAKLYVCGPDGLAMSIYSLADPTLPTLISHFNQVTYVHDVFVRNDTAYLNCADDGLYVYDFSTPTGTQLGSLEWYPFQGYNHAGWLSEDGNIYILADETAGMEMKVCDVSNLTDINVLSTFIAEEPEIAINHLPHNVMYKEGYVYVSHYNDGLQVFDVRDPEEPVTFAYYDTYPQTDLSPFRGAWGVHCFLPSERVLISDRQTGLYLFKINFPPEIESELAHGFYPNPFTDQAVFSFDNPNGLIYDLIIFDSRGREVQHYYNHSLDYIRVQRAALDAGVYFYELRGVNNKYQKIGKVIMY